MATSPIRAFTAFPLLLLLACSGDVDMEGARPPDPGAANLSPEEKGVLDEINEERTSRGLTAVVIADDLECAARVHSKDIGEHEACSHDDSDGSGPGERVEACDGSGWSGEIVACGQTTPREAVNGWLGSPGHKRIMLDPDQKKVGIAMHNNYWTAVFRK